MLKRRLIHRVLFFAVVLSSVVVFAADMAKIEPTLHKVAMRDGTKLATDVYLPSEVEGPCRVVLMRTPYGRASGQCEAHKYCRKGYVFVSQDIRGRGQSEGHNWIIFHNGGKGKPRIARNTVYLSNRCASHIAADLSRIVNSTWRGHLALVFSRIKQSPDVHNEISRPGRPRDTRAGCPRHERRSG